MATISKENYLKAIYKLAEGNGKLVTSSELAIELDVSKAAISEMAKKLAVLGYINYQRYKGIKILLKGKKLALDIIRKHRLWELFLVNTLGLSWEEVHCEAEKLEHSTSQFLIDKIDEHLEFPQLDPHGEPIPSKNGNYRSVINDIPMQECEVGNVYRVARVNDRNKDLIKYLSQINIKLNKEIKILNKLEFDGSVIIEVGGISHSLSEKLVDNIFLTKVKG
ncbi:MAG: metal-dependent transcriptional regulator [Ignavibacteriae bacterium]|nr:metal-dependent transcriptional regulator [Ignavibacteriota bacterium]